MKYLWTLLLLVSCLGLVALGADVVDNGTVEAPGLLLLLLPVIVAIVVAVMERMGKKDLLKKLKGAMEVGRVVFAAIEECEAVGPKKLVSRAIEAASTSDEAKEIAGLLHTVTDVKAATAGNVPPVKKFWRRLIRGQNLVGVAAKIGLQAGIQDLINRED